MQQARLFFLLLCLAMAAGADARPRHERSAGAAQAQTNVPGEFDYYTLALSWSPAYCATHQDPNQCDSGRRLGFVLHGLWPQYNKGYPSDCSTQQLSAAERERYAPLYPSPKLIVHEWSKHGTCSGLAPAAYFELSAQLQRQVAIPPAYQRPATPLRTSNADFIASFAKANPGLPADGLLPFCSGGGRFLSEIRVCYDKRGGALGCNAGEVKRSEKSCGQASFLVQSVR